MALDAARDHVLPLGTDLQGRDKNDESKTEIYKSKNFYFSFGLLLIGQPRAVMTDRCIKSDICITLQELVESAE